MLVGLTLFQQQLSIDIWAKKGLEHLASPFFDKFFSAVTDLGSPTALILLTFLVSLVLIYNRRRLEGIFVAATMLTGWGLMDEIKILVGRPRPAGEHLTYASGYSFPSGHSMLSLVFYGFVVYVLLTTGVVKSKMTAILIAALLILLIGVSRIYLNVHYASDVLGGFIIGGILLLVSVRLMNWGRYRWFSN